MGTFLIFSKGNENSEDVEKIKKTLDCHTSDEGIKYNGMIVLGGDGTVLRAVSHYENPMVYAINCGRVGYLCPIAYSEIDELIQILKNNGKTRFFEAKRLRLAPNRCFLNEVILRSSSFRLSEFKISVDDMSLALRADAIMVSTKTGSSGYNMSINGPLLLSDCIVINAIAPNGCVFRPIVCNLESRIHVEMNGDDPVVIADGSTVDCRCLDISYDGTRVRFGYLDAFNASKRVADLFLLK